MKKNIKQDRKITNLVRAVSVNLNNATQHKLNVLDIIMKEYKRITNVFIQKYIDVEKLPLRITDKTDTWLSARMQRKCGDHAISIIKSCRTNERKHRYQRYKIVYKYFLQRNRQLKFLNKRFSELNLRRHYNPILKQDVMVLDGDIVTYLDDLHSEFDKWIKITSIGNRIKLVIPFNKHRQYNKYVKTSWKRMSGCRLKKINGTWFLDINFEKKITPKQGNIGLGLDQGKLKLLSTTENKVYGTELNKMLHKLINKKHGSKASKTLVKRIKQYIYQEVKKLPTNYDFYVLEDLTDIQIGTTKRKKKRNKTERKLTSRWQLDTLHRAINNYCDLNGIQIKYIDPTNTSRTCPCCGNVDKRNRNNEIFKCMGCGYTADADINASFNILNRFYQENGLYDHVTIPDSKKTKDYIFL